MSQDDHQPTPTSPPEAEPEVETLTVDIETLTLLQVSFLEEYTGLNKIEILKELETPDLMPMSITIALVAMKFNPVDPRQAISEAEQTKVVDL